MKFTKMHGIGNDYIYVNCFEEKLEDPSRLAIVMSRYHFGVGSDGLILIGPSDTADFSMRIFNSDGSEADMCGNGIRCVGKYVYDRGLTDKTALTVETGAGLRRVRLQTENGSVCSVTVDLGRPDFTPADVPVLDGGDRFMNRKLEVDGREWTGTALSVGNPHLVIFLDEDVDGLALEKLGPQFENHPLFPDRVNTEFVSVLPDKSLKMRVWERGSGETQACGTGACAAVVAAIEQGLCDRNVDVTVKVRGGELTVCCTESAIYLTGETESVFTGVVEY